MSNTGPTHAVQCENVMYFDSNLEEDLRSRLMYAQENNTKYPTTEYDIPKKKTLRRATSGSQLLLTSPNVLQEPIHPYDVHTVSSVPAANVRVHQQGFSLRNTQELSIPQALKINNNNNKTPQNTKNHNPFSNLHQLHNALDNNNQQSIAISIPPPMYAQQYQLNTAVSSATSDQNVPDRDMLQQAYQRLVGTSPANTTLNHFVPKTSASSIFNLHQTYPTPSNISRSGHNKLQQQYRTLHKNQTSASESLDFPELSGKYHVLEKVGEGTFSSVYKAVVNGSDAIVALKRINPTCSPSRIINEINCLKKLGGRCYVPPILGAMRLFDQVTLVLPYLPHTKFKDYLPFFTLKQMRDYMHALFTALHHIHMNGIIHRDIKPGNFLFQAETNTFLLVDFGLAATTKQLHHESPVKLSHSQSAENLHSASRSIPIMKVSTPPLPYTAISSPTHSNSNLPSPQLSPTPAACEETKHADSDSELTAPRKLTDIPISPLTRKRSYDSLVSFTQSPAPSNNNTNSSFNDSVDSDASFTPNKSKRNKSSSSSENLHFPAVWNTSRFANNTNVLQGVQKMQAQVFQTSSDLSQKDMAHAPRAGTRGFRAPEVLMRSWEQTTDIWSAGVIMLSLLSTRYPFFLSPDDMTGLAEIAAVFGTVEVFQAGLQLNRRILFPRVFPKQDLKYLCTCLSQTRNIQVPDSAYDLLEKCLRVNPKARITAEEALAHPFFQK